MLILTTSPTSDFGKTYTDHPLGVAVGLAEHALVGLCPECAGDVHLRRTGRAFCKRCRTRYKVQLVARLERL